MTPGGRAPRGSAMVIGARGMLGRELVAACARSGIACQAVNGRAELDIANEAAVDAAIVRSRPSIVFNAAGFTDVDGAETERAAAEAANHLGPGALAHTCARHGGLLVHFSTDYVFEGRTTKPYQPGDATNPVNYYGHTKRAGEDAIRTSGCEHLIIRTSWLYAQHGRNFVATILRLARERSELKVVNDQRGRPTYARDLAEAALRLVEAGGRGVFHVTNSGACTWFEFASAIVRLAGLSCDVRPCTTAEFPRPAPRPAYSVLDIEETEQLIGPMRAWTEALADCLARFDAAAPAPSLAR